MTNRNPAVTTTDNEDMEVTEDQRVFPSWSDLPSPAVENIYSFLNRADQKRMSLVCRNWRREYSSPSLWRNVTFCLPDSASSTEMFPEVIFARMFRHVEIVFPMLSDTLEEPLSLPSDGIMSQLIVFLEAVARRSQLLSISFKYMHFYFMKANEAQRLSVVRQKILDLLKSQKKLRCVEFVNTEFKKAEAAEILNVVFANNWKTLRCLHLVGFIQKQSEEEFEDNFVGGDLNYNVLMNLKKLAIDYNLFENMISSFYEYRNKVAINGRKGCLENVVLNCNGYNIVDQVSIQPPVWNYLRDIFPGLRILVRLICPCDPLRFSTYIVPRMPLRVLFYKSIFREAQVMEIGSLLRHITSCNTSEIIQELKVDWEGVSPNFAPDLISFTKVSPELKYLDLVIEHPIAGLDTVFKSWYENRPASLVAVDITVRHVQTEEEKTVYTDLVDFYAPLLQPLELSVSFIAENELFRLIIVGDNIPV